MASRATRSTALESSPARQLVKSSPLSSKKSPPLKGGKKSTEKAEIPASSLDSDDDILRPPESSSDDESPSRKNADIKRTTFETKPKPNSRTSAYGNGSTRKSARNEKRPDPFSSQSSGSSNSKRKLGAGVNDDYGFTRSSQPKGKKASYGKAAKQFKNFRAPKSENDATPEKKFKHIDSSQSGLENSPIKAPKEVKKLEDESDSDVETKFKRFVEEEEEQLSPIKADGFKHMATDSGPLHTSQESTNFENLPATQYIPFKTFGDDSDFNISSVLGSQGDIGAIISSAAPVEEEKEEVLPPHQRRCPMCRKPVDLKALEGQGGMNTRQQEEFCRSHQRKTAETEWASKGYPKINWEKLDRRISKHHAFIRKLINGGPSHYRDILDEKVKSGQERSLLKTTQHLTPGYYGSRGLRVMSENIMHEFTPLLKKRAPKDRLISARGPTAFVQLVCVPEVGVLLIMEDINVGENEAQDILDESVEIGELINEEVREVVNRRVEDSEEEDDDV